MTKLIQDIIQIWHQDSTYVNQGKLSKTVRTHGKASK